MATCPFIRLITIKYELCETPRTLHSAYHFGEKSLYDTCACQQSASAFLQPGCPPSVEVSLAFLCNRSLQKAAGRPLSNDDIPLWLGCGRSTVCSGCVRGILCKVLALCMRRARQR